MCVVNYEDETKMLDIMNKRFLVKTESMKVRVFVLYRPINFW